MTIFTIRQTELDLPTLVLKLSMNRSSNTLTLINDLGIIFLNEVMPKQKIQIAEGALIRSLVSRDEDVRRASYYYLKCADRTISNYARASVDVFKRQPINRHIVKDIAERYWLS